MPKKEAKEVHNSLINEKYIQNISANFIIHSCISKIIYKKGLFLLL